MSHLSTGRRNVTTHLHLCSHPDTVNNRQASLDDLERTLHSIDTPQTITAAITYGFENWCHAPPSQHIRALTAGSLRGPDAVLTSAFHEQVRDIGWYHFCVGRISNKWSSAQHHSVITHLIALVSNGPLFSSPLYGDTPGLYEKSETQ
jgi:hypothetical protein